MRQQHQTISDGKTGDCFRACMANVLDLDLDVVPNFCAHEDWWERTQQWLRGLNLFFCEIESKDGKLPPVPPLANRSICFAAGVGPRGIRHAVLCRYRRNRKKKEHWLELEHDPHPSGAGIDKIDIVGWLMVIDPSRPIGMKTSGQPRITEEQMGALIERVEKGELLSNPLLESEYLAIEDALKQYWLSASALKGKA